MSDTRAEHQEPLRMCLPRTRHTALRRATNTRDTRDRIRGLRADSAYAGDVATGANRTDPMESGVNRSADTSSRTASGD